MAEMQVALRQRIATAVGHDRVFWTIVPQGAELPHVRLQTVSDPRPEHLKGPIGLRETRVQVDVMARKYGEARPAAEAIIQGVAQPATVEGVQFSRIRAEGPRDLGEDTSSGYVHRLSSDLLVWHSLA